MTVTVACVKLFGIWISVGLLSRNTFLKKASLASFLSFAQWFKIEVSLVLVVIIFIYFDLPTLIRHDNKMTKRGRR